MTLPTFLQHTTISCHHDLLTGQHRQRTKPQASTKPGTQPRASTATTCNNGSCSTNPDLIIMQQRESYPVLCTVLYCTEPLCSPSHMINHNSTPAHMPHRQRPLQPLDFLSTDIRFQAQPKARQFQAPHSSPHTRNIPGKASTCTEKNLTSNLLQQQGTRDQVTVLVPIIPRGYCSDIVFLRRIRKGYSNKHGLCRLQPSGPDASFFSAHQCPACLQCITRAAAITHTTPLTCIHLVKRYKFERHAAAGTLSAPAFQHACKRACSAAAMLCDLGLCHSH